MLKIVGIQNGRHCAINADHGSDFHPLANHMTMLINFISGEIHEFSAFPFQVQHIIAS